MDTQITVYARIDKLNMFIIFNQITLFYQDSIPITGGQQVKQEHIFNRYNKTKYKFKESNISLK